MAPGAPSAHWNIAELQAQQAECFQLAARSAMRSDQGETQENNVVPKSQELQR